MKTPSLAIVAVAMLVGLIPATSSASPVTEPSFNESSGCGAAAGITTPLTTTGDPGSWIPYGHEVRGPWANAFGRNYSQIVGQMVTWIVPMSAGLTVQVHKKALPAFQQVTANLAVAQAEGKYYAIRLAGAMVWRRISGSPRMSMHAFGTAVDLNWDTNPYTSTEPLPPKSSYTDMPDWFVEAWRDAGFCWGGDWTTIKDAMHFSWKGTAFTPGYGPPPAPVAPLTTAESWTRRIFKRKAAFGVAGGDQIQILDAGRDGGPDVVRITRTGEAMLNIDILHGSRELTSCSWQRRVAGDVPGGAEGFFMADADGDSRADIWAYATGGATTTVWISTFAGGFRTWSSHSIPLAGSKADALLVGDYNRDGLADLYAIDLKTSAAVIRVFDGSNGWQDQILARTRPLPWQPTTALIGERDGDGIPDLVFAGVQGIHEVALTRGANDYTSKTLKTTGAAIGGRAFGFADWDGDGRDDLFRISSGGMVKIYIGGSTASKYMFWVRLSGQACTPVNYPARGWDLNGDNLADAVVGAPGESLAGEVGVGAAFVTYGDPDGFQAADKAILLTSNLGIPTFQENAGFASAVASGDFDRDGYADLLVGIPGQTVNNKKEAGAVGWWKGSADGVGEPTLLTADTMNVAGVVAAKDRFGATLATGDFNGDGYVDAAVGSPKADVKGVNSAGAVTILYGSGQLGLTGKFGDRVSQASPGVSGAPQENDQFGTALAVGDFNGDGFDDIAIGTPQDDLMGEKNAGLAHVLFGSQSGLGTLTSIRLDATTSDGSQPQKWSRFGQALAAGDVDGDGFDDLVVGEPKRAGSGAVWLFKGSTSGFANPRVLTQDSLSVGKSEAGDLFGWAVAVLDMDDDGFAEVAIGVPGETVTGTAGAGGLQIVAGTSLAVDGSASWWLQQGAGLDGIPETGDGVGTFLRSIDLNGDHLYELLVGVPDEDVAAIADSGQVHIVTMGTKGPVEGFGGPYYSGVGFSGTLESGDLFGSG